MAFKTRKLIGASAALVAAAATTLTVIPEASAKTTIPTNLPADQVELSGNCISASELYAAAVKTDLTWYAEPHLPPAGVWIDSPKVSSPWQPSAWLIANFSQFVTDGAACIVSPVIPTTVPPTTTTPTTSTPPKPTTPTTVTITTVAPTTTTVAPTTSTTANQPTTSTTTCSTQSGFNVVTDVVYSAKGHKSPDMVALGNLSGGTVSASFDAACDTTVTLVAYTAPKSTWDNGTDLPQYEFDHDTFTGTGPGTLTVNVPKGHYQVDFIYGYAVSPLTAPNTYAGRMVGNDLNGDAANNG